MSSQRPGRLITPVYQCRRCRALLTDAEYFAHCLMGVCVHCCEDETHGPPISPLKERQEERRR